MFSLANTPEVSRRIGNALRLTRALLLLEDHYVVEEIEYSVGADAHAPIDVNTSCVDVNTAGIGVNTAGRGVRAGRDARRFDAHELDWLETDSIDWEVDSQEPCFARSRRYSDRSAWEEPAGRREHPHRVAARLQPRPRRHCAPPPAEHVCLCPIVGKPASGRHGARA